jgi:hypothetical protein
MSFFGLGDINFKKDSRETFGPLAALEGSAFEKNTYRYPLDAGNFDKGHYMVFYVRKQKQSKTTALPPSDYDQEIMRKNANAQPQGTINKINYGTEIGKKINDFSNKISSQISSKYGTNPIANRVSDFLNVGPKVTNYGSTEGTNDVINNSVKEITKERKGFYDFETTTLTTDAIALYMPDTLAFSNPQTYSDLKPGLEILGQLAVAAPGLVDAYKSGGGKAAFQAALKSGLAQTLGSRFVETLGGGDVGRASILGVTGKVANPMMELIYTAPSFRNFQFDFFFYPRSESEALQVQQIINRLRYHQAPELSTFTSGRPDGLLIPPSQFDIKFYYGGKQNPNIPPVATCVLNDITLNYAPNGWSAYEVPGENDPQIGRTGMPVAIQMTLQFTEITYLTKQDFNEDLSITNTINRTNDTQMT